MRKGLTTNYKVGDILIWKPWSGVTNIIQIISETGTHYDFKYLKVEKDYGFRKFGKDSIMAIAHVKPAQIRLK